MLPRLFSRELLSQFGQFTQINKVPLRIQGYLIAISKQTEQFGTLEFLCRLLESGQFIKKIYKLL